MKSLTIQPTGCGSRRTSPVGSTCRSDCQSDQEFRCRGTRRGFAEPLRQLVGSALLFGTILSVGSACAEDWPAFRGPRGDGGTADQAPKVWNDSENVAWKAELPQPANGSPIVSAGRVLVSSAEDKLGMQRSLYCFDRKTGQQLWVQTVELEKEMPRHETNPHCSSTPASDGQRVVVWHATAGLHCYDLDGEPLWSRDLGEFRHMWGNGASPVIYRSQVILHTGPGAKSFVMSLDLRSGETQWKHEVPQQGNGERRDDDAPMGSWSTPVITHVDGADQIVVMLPDRVNAYDPATGDVIWTCGGVGHDRGDLAYSSPVIADDLCFVTGGYQGPAMSIRLGGSGDVTASHRLWRTERNPQSIGSGVYAAGCVFRPNADAAKGLQCVDPKSGEVRWSQRTPAGHWGSLVMAADLLYVTDQDGTTTVMAANPDRYEEIARNELGEACNSTPAISDGQIFIRTHSHLVCIGR